MIVANKYKVFWHHQQPTYSYPEGILEKKIKLKFLKYEKGWSQCIINIFIESQDQKFEQTFRDYTWNQPERKYNRKTGLFYSFQGAVDRIEDKNIRNLMWEEFWKTRKKPLKKIYKINIK